MTLKLKRRARPEDLVQYQVIEALITRGVEDIYFFATPMGGKRPKSEGARMKRLGARAGIPDLGVVKAGRVYFLELKRESGGRVSDTQRGAHAEIKRAGAEVATAYGVDEALRILHNWQLIR